MPNPADSSPIAWWESLKHGGMLIAPARVASAFTAAPDQLAPWHADRLRREIVRAEAHTSDLADLLDVVLENICGFTVGWFKGSRVGTEWSTRTPAGENIKPRRVWQHEGGTLPVFVDEEPRLGIGRGRRCVARVIEWLRARSLNLALLTNGRQWRLIYAGTDHDAHCEWDTQLWFAEGEPGLQVDALRRLISPAAWKAPPPAHGETKHCPLLQAILDSRKGQNELSAILGERVRQAVELLIRSHGPALDRVTANVLEGQTPIDARDIYAAAVRTVMRMVVLMFAESRLLMPLDRSPLYFNAYSLTGLRESLESAHARGPALLHSRRSAWPRVLALFALVRDGCGHPDLSVPKYGGDLFTTGPSPIQSDPNSGMSRALAVFESACFQSDFEGVMSDADVRDILEKLSYSEVTIRQGRAGGGSIPTRVPVDFSDLQSEYIGILYEGLLDFELRRAGADEPIVFLAIGDEPALPLSRLEAMDDTAIKNLVEKFKVKGGSEEEAEEGADDADAEEEDDSAAEEPSLIADDVAEEPAADADAAAEGAAELDPTQQARQRAWAWARRAVSVGGMVRRPKTKKAEAIAQYEREVEAAGRKLVRTAILPGQWYLVRWGGTRKGSGTFYTRPQLSVPTVHRTLRPLAYIAPVDNADAPTAAWTPKRPEEILALKVCDPAVGSGSFPVAALRFLTDALYRSLEHHGRLRDEGNRTVIALAEGRESVGRLDEDLLPCRPSDADFEPRLKARLRRYIVERCLYGVDLDPLAIELGKIALWIETMDRELPFSFLDHKFKCGNALVGCWFDRFRHYPIMAWLREGGDKGHTTGVHFAKEARTKAIARHLKDVVKPDLLAFIERFRDTMPMFDASGKTAEQVHDEALAILEKMHSLPPGEDGEHRRAQLHRQLRESPAYVALKRAFDCWCALWFWPADALAAAPLASTFTALSPESIAVAERLARERRFFHWELEFPDVFAAKAAGDHSSAGFDAIIGNPPWDISKPNSKEFFSSIDPLYRTYGKQDALVRQKGYFAASPPDEERWLDYTANFKAMSNYIDAAGHPFGDRVTVKDDGAGNIKKTHDSPLGDRGRDSFASSAARHAAWAKRRAAGDGSLGYADPAHPFLHQGSADINLYKCFTEMAHALLRAGGRLGFILPSGLYTDHGTTALRSLLLSRCRWEWLFGFENRDKVFDIDSRFKFNPIIVVKGGATESIRTAFMQRDPDDWALGIAESLAVPYALAQVERFSPRSKAILEIRSARDLAVLEKIYANSVLLGDSGPNGWGITYAREFDMTNESALFPPRPKWEERGYRPDEYSRWIKGNWQPRGGSPLRGGACDSLAPAGPRAVATGEARAARAQPVEAKTNDSPAPAGAAGFRTTRHSSAPPGRGEEETDGMSATSLHGLRESQSGLAPPVATGRNPAGVEEAPARIMPTPDNPAPLGAARADIAPGIILSRDGGAYIREEEIDWEVEMVDDGNGNEVEVRHRAVALPLYEGRMIGQFDFSEKGWVSGKGRGAVWRQIEWTNKQVEPQFLMSQHKYESTDVMCRGFKTGIMDVTSATNKRTVIATTLGAFPCGHKVPTLCPTSGRPEFVSACTATMDSFVFDHLVRGRLGGQSLIWGVLAESPVTQALFDNASVLSRMSASLTLTQISAADGWARLVREDYRDDSHPLIGWRSHWAVTLHERLRLRCILDAVVAALYGLDLDDLKWILKDCDHPAASITSKAFARRLDPKGFWRVDKREPPERRHTVLTLAAFADLQSLIAALTAAGGTREDAIAAFCGLGAGEDEDDTADSVISGSPSSAPAGPGAVATGEARASRAQPVDMDAHHGPAPAGAEEVPLNDIRAQAARHSAAPPGRTDSKTPASTGSGGAAPPPPVATTRNPAGVEGGAERAESALPGTAHGSPGTGHSAPGTGHSLPDTRAASLQPSRTTLQTARTTVQPSRTTLQLIRNILQTSRTMFQTDGTIIQPGRTTVQPLRTPDSPLPAAPVRLLGSIDPVGGEGWMLPETLRLADPPLGLGHDDRAQEPQAVASVLGPRFYDWQLAQDPAESWRECELHARNLLGAEGFEKLKAELEGREVPASPNPQSPTSNPKKTGDTPTLFG